MSALDRTCLIEGCKGTYRAKGYCRTHYERNLKFGGPLEGPRPPRPVGERFCEIEGCDTAAPKRRLCSHHSMGRWRAANLDHAREVGRHNRRLFYANNVERVAEENRHYRILHPEVMLAHSAKRRDLILNHPDYRPFPASEWDALVRRFDYRCAYCGEKPEVLEMEHVVPISRGGRHAIANIVPSCVPCNRSKFTHFLSEWKLMLSKRAEPASAA